MEAFGEWGGMDNKRLALSVLVGGVGLGIVSLASTSVRDFVDGFLGIPQQPAVSPDGSIELRADLAAATLNTPLRPEEFDELMQGFAFLSRAQYAEAVSIIGRYALLCDDMAQHAFGGMYSFGQGLPLDREEGLRWLALASAQGNRGAAELAATINATPGWERRVSALSAAAHATGGLERSHADSGTAYSESAFPAPQYDPSANLPGQSYRVPNSVIGISAAPAIASSRSASMGARASIEQAYGSEPAGRRYSGAQVGLLQLGSSSPIVLNHAGPGTYSDRSGDIYAQAGPQGVVNTRTGEFSPTN